MSAVIPQHSAGEKHSESTRGATDRLLRAIKEKALREGGRIDSEKLRREGYSENLIARLLEL
jgi:hypothetical protein